MYFTLYPAILHNFFFNFFKKYNFKLLASRNNTKLSIKRLMRYLRITFIIDIIKYKIIKYNLFSLFRKTQ